jgi:hypothetical protein
MTPLCITEEEFGNYLEFCIDMCERNRVVWRIERPDGSAVMCVPVNQVPAISQEVQDQVEEFRKHFLDNTPADTI